MPPILLGFAGFSYILIFYTADGLFRALIYQNKKNNQRNQLKKIIKRIGKNFG